MDIVILFAPNFPELAEQFASLNAQKLTVIEQDHDIYPLVEKHKLVSVSYETWNFVCMNIESCFDDNFAQNLKKLSKNQELYMFAVNDSVNGLWFEQYKNGQLSRHWMEVDLEIEGNMGEYLPAEHALNYPFIDEPYEDVGQELFYEMIFEITGFDITETF